jgi:hypothetical protein
MQKSGDAGSSKRSHERTEGQSQQLSQSAPLDLTRHQRYNNSAQGKEVRERYENSAQGKEARARAHERSNAERDAKRFGQEKADIPVNRAVLHPDTRPGEEGVLSFDTRRSYVPAEMLRRELAEGRARGEQPDTDPRWRQATKEIENQKTEPDDKTDKRLNS